MPKSGRLIRSTKDERSVGVRQKHYQRDADIQSLMFNAVLEPVAIKPSASKTDIRREDRYQVDGGYLLTSSHQTAPS
jgi:hypothetical protein